MAKRGVQRSQDKRLREREDLIRRSPVLSDGAKILWIEIARGWAWNDRTCYPSQATLADALGWTPRRVRRNLAELVKHCLIRVSRSNKHQQNIYELPDRIPESVCDPARLINKNLSRVLDLRGGAESGHRTQASSAQGKHRTQTSSGTGRKCPQAQDANVLRHRTQASSEDELREDELREDEPTEEMRDPEVARPSESQSASDDGSSQRVEGEGLEDLIEETSAEVKQPIRPRVRGARKRRRADSALVPQVPTVPPETPSVEVDYVRASPPLPSKPGDVLELLRGEIELKYGARAAATVPAVLDGKQVGQLRRLILDKYTPDVVLAMVRVLVWDWEIAREVSWPPNKDVARPEIDHLISYRTSLSSATTDGFPHKPRGHRGSHKSYASQYLRDQPQADQDNPF